MTTREVLNRYARTYRQTEGGRAARDRVTAARYARGKAVVTAAKSAGCVDCGARPPIELDFDHLPTYQKTRNVSKLLTGSLATLEAEIAKCEVVCKDCHKARTAQRRKVA